MNMLNNNQTFSISSINNKPCAVSCSDGRYCSFFSSDAIVVNPPLLLAVVKSVCGDEVVDFYRITSASTTTLTIFAIFSSLMMLMVMMVLPTTR